MNSVGVKYLLSIQSGDKKVKKIRFLAIILCSAAVWGTTLNASAQSETIFDVLKNKLAGNEKPPSVEEIIQETKEIKDEVKDLSQNYVIESIKKYNKMIADIRTEVNSKSWFIYEKTDAEKFQVILDGIEEMKDFYNRLNKEKQDVRKEMFSYIESVKSFSKELDRKIPEEKREKERLEREYNNIDPKYSAEEKEIKRNGLRKRITFCERRVKILQDFTKNYYKLSPILEDARKSIDKFIFIIEESAGVYNDAYRTLKLQKDISNAYRTIDELKSLDYLSENIMKSWEDLENIVNILSDQVVGFDDAV